MCFRAGCSLNGHYFKVSDDVTFPFILATFHQSPWDCEGSNCGGQEVAVLGIGSHLAAALRRNHFDTMTKRRDLRRGKEEDGWKEIVA